MAALLLVAVGGAFGAVARYLLTDWVRAGFGDAFPWGTMVVNVLGCLLLGGLLVWLQSHAPSERVRLFVAIGVLGSFTTFSTYSWETVELVRTGALWRAAGYAVGSLTLGVLAAAAGASLAIAMLQGRG